MTSHSQWIHIADHAWDRYGVGCQYTVHQENREWIARGFSLDATGAATVEAEQSAITLEEAKQIVDRWEYLGTCQRRA